MSEPSRPVVRWHGGKWKLAPWIVAQMPAHRAYVEPFGGAASVLLRKPRSYAEVYNDLDEEIVTLFRVLREESSAERLTHLLRLTPFARNEFRLAYEQCADPIERARRLVIRSYMGFGSNAHASDANGHRSTGFRSNSMTARGASRQRQKQSITPPRSRADARAGAQLSPSFLSQLMSGAMMEGWSNDGRSALWRQKSETQEAQHHPSIPP